MDNDKQSNQAIDNENTVQLAVVSQQKLTLFDLPVEIRMLIYSFLFSEASRIHLIESDNTTLRCCLLSAIFYVCKQIQFEAAVVLLRACEYRIWYETVRCIDSMCSRPWYFEDIRTLVLRCDGVLHPARRFKHDKLNFLIDMKRLEQVTVDYRAMPDEKVSKPDNTEADYYHNKMRERFQIVISSHDRVGRYLKQIPGRSFKLYMALYFRIENPPSTPMIPCWTRLQAKFNLDNDEIITSRFTAAVDATKDPKRILGLANVGSQFHITSET